MPLFVVGQSAAGSADTLAGVDTATVPTTITDLAVTPTSATIDLDETTESVTLSWTKPGGIVAPSIRYPHALWLGNTGGAGDLAIVSQTIWQRFNGGPFTALVTLNDVPNTYVVNVAVGEYQWYITTTNAIGTSAASNTVSLFAVAGSIVGAQASILQRAHLWIGVIAADGTTINVSATGTAKQWSDTAHGNHQAMVTITGQDARAVVQMFRKGAVALRVRNDAALLWHGWVEDWTVRYDTLEVTAYGHWAIVSLVPYSEFWSSKKPSDWRAHPGLGFMGLSWPFFPAGAVNADWEISTQDDKIYIAPRMDYTYVSTDWGLTSFRIANGGVRRRSITQFQCTWSFANQAINPDMQVVLFTLGSVNGVHQLIYDSATYSYARWELQTASSPSSGSVVVTFTEPNITELLLIVGITTSAQAFVGTRNEDWFDLRPRVLSTTAPTVTPNAIAADIVAHVNAHNPGYLSANTSQIASVAAIDLANMRFEDADCGDVLRQMASYGTPGGSTPLDVGIGTTGLLYFRLPLAAGAGDTANGRHVREVRLPIPPTEARYSLNALVNAAYGTYDTDYGTERTAPTIDSTSVTQFGRKRMHAIAALTGTAQLQPQQLLVSDNATPQPAVEVEVTELVDTFNQPVPLWDVRRGDWLVIDGTQLGILSNQVLRLRIRILETRYDADADSLTLVLENAPPRLPVLLAQALLNQ